jgi:hypothetical protein
MAVFLRAKIASIPAHASALSLSALSTAFSVEALAVQYAPASGVHLLHLVRHEANEQACVALHNLSCYRSSAQLLIRQGVHLQVLDIVLETESFEVRASLISTLSQLSLLDACLEDLLLEGQVPKQNSPDG